VSPDGDCGRQPPSPGRAYHRRTDSEAGQQDGWLRTAVDQEWPTRARLPDEVVPDETCSAKRRSSPAPSAPYGGSRPTPPGGRHATRTGRRRGTGVASRRGARLVQAGRHAARHVHDHHGPAGTYVGERDRIPFGRMRGENDYLPPCRWEDQGQKVRRDARPFGPAVPHDARRT